MHEVDAVGEVRGQHAEAGPDLEHDVVGAELRQPPDHVEDVLVHEPVLSELAFRAGAHGKRKTVEALASIRCSSACASSPRASANAASVCIT